MARVGALQAIEGTFESAEPYGIAPVPQACDLVLQAVDRHQPWLHQRRHPDAHKVPPIFAIGNIGDVVGQPLRAHTVVHEAQVAEVIAGGLQDNTELAWDGPKSGHLWREAVNHCFHHAQCRYLPNTRVHRAGLRATAHDTGTRATFVGDRCAAHRGDGVGLAPERDEAAPPAPEDEVAQCIGWSEMATALLLTLQGRAGHRPALLRGAHAG